MPGRPRNRNWRPELIAHLQQGRSLSLACRLADVSAQTVLNARAADPKLDEQVRSLLKPTGRKKQGWRPWMVHLLQLMRKGATFGAATKQLGLSSGCVYSARQRYPDFDQAVTQLQQRQADGTAHRTRLPPLTHAQKELVAFALGPGYDLLLQTLHVELDQATFSRVVAAIRAAVGE
jgi:hypothetical protein